MRRRRGRRRFALPYRIRLRHPRAIDELSHVDMNVRRLSPPATRCSYNPAMIEITFLGAAETVTGSKYLLTAVDSRLLIDCGLFQGLKELRERNWHKLPVAPSSIEGVVLTHAHIDHIGYLPRLVRDGFQAPVWCTDATADLAELMLLDAAKNQEEESEYANRKGYSKHKPALPLFDERDAAAAIKLLRRVERGKWFSPREPFHMCYHDAGHLLGSSSIEVEVRSGGAARPLRIVFSGDVGRQNAPLYHDPAPPPACDYLICESTYGGREHAEEHVLDQLAEVVQSSIARGGVMLVAAFAVGRAQQLIYLMRILAEQKRIPPIPVYLDSPMAIKATRIYLEHARDHDLSDSNVVDLDNFLSSPQVKLTTSAQESKAINAVGGPAVIISASGMMTGGRILHHLRQRLPHPRNTIVLGGYMAPGTRGRMLADGVKRMRMHGGEVPVRAAIERMSALSGHADHSELMDWLSQLPAPKQTFMTHGEIPNALALAEALRRDRGWNVTVPRMGETFALEAAPS